jgi:hypothetical protein
MSSLPVTGLVLALAGFAACAHSNTIPGFTGSQGAGGGTSSSAGGTGGAPSSSSSSSSSGTGGQGGASSSSSTPASSSTTASSSSSSGTGGQASVTSSSSGGSDAGALDAGTTDGGYTSTNPLQVDLSSIFNADTVANSSAQGKSYPPLVSMDGSGYDYMSEAVAVANGDTNAGIPDDGFYAADADHPDVQLAFSDLGVGPNSVLMNAPSPMVLTVTFPIVATSYSTVQLYATSTEGSSSVTVTLTYSDTSTDVTSVIVPDWGQSSSAAAPVFVVQSDLSRFSMTDPTDFSDDFALYGITTVANPAKTLASVTVTVAGGETNRFILYGATAY